MADMRVYLTDGFAGDHVIVSVNGQTVFDGNATTKKLYGLAEQLKPVQVSGSSATMEVRLPEKKLAATFNVDLNQGAHVPVTLEDGKLRHSVQKRIGFM